jgi:hypothetical protein
VDQNNGSNAQGRSKMMGVMHREEQNDGSNAQRGAK